MKYIKLSFLSLILLLTINVYAGKPKDTHLKYNITCNGVGKEGYSLVSVCVFIDKSSEINEDIIKKCAIHGLIFSGFSGNGQDCISQPPLAGSPIAEQEHADFFKAFFEDGGPYENYATVIDGSIRTEKFNKQYKITASVSISKTILRKDLEKAGVINSLSRGF